ncbi:MAG TPA: class I SAM-dependent methyltransferase [Candidatus Angelobacter sp.]
MTSTNVLLDSSMSLTLEKATVQSRMMRYLRRLRSTYSACLEQYQKQRSGELPLVVWQLGTDSGKGPELARLISSDWPLETKWLHLRSSEPTKGGASCKYRKIEYFPISTDIIAQGKEAVARFTVARMQTLLGEINSQCGLVKADDELAGMIGKLREEIWPDVVIVDGFVSHHILKLDPESVQDYLNFLFHFLDPGGILILSEPTHADLKREIGEFLDSNRGALVCSETRMIGELHKEPNIYMDHSLKIADRKAIFKADICEDIILHSISGMELSEGSGKRILDVGVGDGRFSRHIARVSQMRGWLYQGIDASPHEEFHSTHAELKGLVQLDSNFFQFKPGYQYGAVFMFFILHSFKHWQLYLYKAWQLLEDGGYLVVGMRHDNFTYWLNGIFLLDSGVSPIREIWENYWSVRQQLGLRNPIQMLTAVWPTLSIEAAEKLGFEFVREGPLMASGLRHYSMQMDDLRPAEDKPVFWNIARVGVTAQDRRCLIKELESRSYEDNLYETEVALVFQKKSKKSKKLK